MPLEITICLLDVFLPAAILMYNIKNINYAKYIQNLLKGCKFNIKSSDASIFIVLRQKLDQSEQSDDFIQAVQVGSTVKSKRIYEPLESSRKSTNDKAYHPCSLESSMLTEDEEDYDQEAYQRNFQSIRIQDKMTESILSRSVYESKPSI